MMYRALISMGFGTKFRMIYYKMKVLGRSLSEGALDRLRDFLDEYYKANRTTIRKTSCRLTGTSGEFRVRAEHADEMAARVAVYIADPSNADPQPIPSVRPTPEMALGDDIEQELRLMRIRDDIRANWPEIIDIDDPLGTVPSPKSNKIGAS